MKSRIFYIFNSGFSSYIMEERGSKVIKLANQYCDNDCINEIQQL